MDRKVFIIRTWLLLIALCGVTLLCPSVGIGVWPLLGMMISTYKCCCPGACRDGCSVYPSEATVVLGGISNGSCASCTTYNNTYVVPLDSAPDGTCRGQEIDTNVCGTGSYVLSWIIGDGVVGAAAGTVRGFVSLDVPPLGFGQWRDDLGASPIDCINTFTLTLFDDLSVTCDFSAATADLSPSV